MTNDADNNLPEGWAQCLVGDVADVVSGGTPKSSDAANFSDDGHPWITPADLSDFTGVFIKRGKRCLTDKGLASCSARLVPPGTVLMSSRAPIGYLAVAANEVCTNQGFKSFVLHAEIDSQFAYYWLWHLRPVVQEMGSGSTFAEVSGSRCRDIPFRFPPTREQKRIVAKVEALLARVNAARERLAKVPALLKRFRQSVLAAACSGQLTADWRDANPDGRSCDGIPKKNLSCLAEEFPSTWLPTRLGCLTTLVTSGSRGWAKYYAKSGSIFIRAQNINSDRLNLDDVAFVHLPNRAEGLRTKVQSDDLLVTITGANVTKSARVDIHFDDAYVSQHVALVRLANPRFSSFLILWIISPGHGRQQLQEAAYGQGKPGLNLDNIRDVEVALPPLDEQRGIVRRAEALFALADKIEARVQAATARVEKITQAILAKAFRGELVPTEAELARQENRDYEPANVLLQRIRAARAADGVKGRKRPARRRNRKR